MFSHSSNATAPTPAPAMPAIQTRPRLSVVLLSRGAVDALERAIEVVLASPFYLETELIVVRACRADEEKARWQRHARQVGFALELAPADTPREALAGIGARAAAGDILAVREDVLAGDPDWLGAFSLHTEQSLWDSTVVRSDGELADRVSAKELAGSSPSRSKTDRSIVPVRPHGVPAWRFGTGAEPAT
jgi:hypothetical protein